MGVPIVEAASEEFEEIRAELQQLACESGLFMAARRVPANITQPNDPAYWMLFDGVETTPTVYSASCYICNDPEYARMGLPLCRKCPTCSGHIPADDSVCDDCDFDEYLAWENAQLLEGQKEVK